MSDPLLAQHMIRQMTGGELVFQGWPPVPSWPTARATPRSCVLDEEDAYAIHAYILERANIDRELREQPVWWVGIRTWFMGLVSKLIALLV